MRVSVKHANYIVYSILGSYSGKRNYGRVRMNIIAYHQKLPLMSSWCYSSYSYDNGVLMVLYLEQWCRFLWLVFTDYLWLHAL